MRGWLAKNNFATQWVANCPIRVRLYIAAALRTISSRRQAGEKGMQCCGARTTRVYDDKHAWYVRTARDAAVACGARTVDRDPRVLKMACA